MKLRVVGLSLLLLASPLLAAPAGFLGVYLSEGGEGERGALVEEIAPDSPAAAAGLRKGDQIVAVGGARTATSKALMDMLGKAQAGTKLELLVERDGWQKTVQVELAARPAAEAPEPGTTPRPPAQERGFLGVYFGQGPQGEAMISGVVEGTPAAAAGLRQNDLVRRLDGKPIADPATLIAELGTRGPGSTIELGIERGGKPSTVKVTLGRRGVETSAPAPKAMPARPVEPDPKAKKPGYLGVALDDAEGKGPLKVDDVQANSPAERFGLLKGDVVLSVGDKPVKTVEQFAKSLEGKLAGEVVMLKIERDGWKNEVRVTLGERQ